LTYILINNYYIFDLFHSPKVTNFVNYDVIYDCNIGLEGA